MRWTHGETYSSISPCRESLALRRDYQCDCVLMSLCCSPCSCSAPLKKCNMDAHCWKYLAAKCLISSWPGNQLHVHAVLRSNSPQQQIDLEKKKTWSQTKGAHWTISTNVHGCVDTCGFFLWLRWGQTEKESFCTFSELLCFLLSSPF